MFKPESNPFKCPRCGRLLPGFKDERVEAWCGHCHCTSEFPGSDTPPSPPPKDPPEDADGSSE